MRASVITSAVLHGLLLGWLLMSFNSARPLELTATESLPVELVPIEELTQLQEGDKQAPKLDQAAKEETKREPTVDDAVNSGDNNFDLKSVPTPADKPSNVQKAAAPKKSENDVAEKDVKAEEVPDVVKEDTAVEPSTEVAAKEEPKVEVATPEPRPDVKPVEDKPVEVAKEEPMPDNVPVPVTRPKEEPKKVEEKKEEPKKVEEKKEKKEEKKPVEVADAKTDKNKNAKKDEKNKKAAKSTTSKDSDFNSDEISDMLSKVDNNSGGAKRNTKKKSFGADSNTGGQKLSQSELDGLKGIIEKNWSIMPGQISDNQIVITVKFELDENGEIIGIPEVKGSGGDDASLRALEGGAKRAVMKSAPFDKLPKEKYNDWRMVTVNFHPSDMM